MFSAELSPGQEVIVLQVVAFSTAVVFVLINVLMVRLWSCREVFFPVSQIEEEISHTDVGRSFFIFCWMYKITLDLWPIDKAIKKIPVTDWKLCCTLFNFPPFTLIVPY